MPVTVEHVPAPDAEMRLTAAFAAILRAAARAAEEAHTKPIDDQKGVDDG